MGLFDAALDSIGGMLSDQWKDIITAPKFTEHTAVASGIRKDSQNGYGDNRGAQDVLSNGTIIYIPENTAAFVFSKAGIEQVITQPGGFEHRNGELSIFDEQDRREKGLKRILVDQTIERIGFSGIDPDEKHVAFVNLHEIRGIRFGTRGPLAYNDLFYGTDLELFAYGTISLHVIDPELFVRNFVPANVYSYTFDDPRAREQLISELLHSFIAAVNGLSDTYRISQLPAHTNDMASIISSEHSNAGSWPERFGLELASIAIENIEFSEESRELVRAYSEKKMSVLAYEGISQHAANVAAQQMIAEGVRDNGLGDGGGFLFGMNLANGLNPQNASMNNQEPALPMQYPSMQLQPNQSIQDSVDTSDASHVATSETSSAGSGFGNLGGQIETLKKLKELVDVGILSNEEFEAKKRQILGI